MIMAILLINLMLPTTIFVHRLARKIDTNTKISAAHDPLEFDVIPDVICSRGKLIIESTGAVIVLMGVPIHPPPTFLFSEPDKFLDE
jgi:hypothetical protein